MFSFENSVTIGRPVEEVFEFASDLERIPQWNYYVQDVSRTSHEAHEVGATYHQVRRSDEQDLRIVAIDQNHRFVVETVPPSKPELRREMTFTAQGESTLIRDLWELDLGVPKLLEPIASRRAKSGVKENLGKLKELLEQGQTTLQDGRQVRLPR